MIRKFLSKLLNPNKEYWEKRIEHWNRHPKVVKITAVFENGLVRSLDGEEAQEWGKLNYLMACGSRDARLKFNETKWNWFTEKPAYYSRIPEGKKGNQSNDEPK